MSFSLTHQAFAILARHAKIHKGLDNLDRRYRDILQTIEQQEIRAFKHEGKFRKLEELKQELLEIRFL